MPYLVCDKCNSYYKLQPGESAKDFDRCERGNKLKYYEYMRDYTKNLENPDTVAGKHNIINLWAEQSTLIKLGSVLGVLCLGVLLIVGMSGIFYSAPNSDSNTLTGDGSKLNLIILYASWCSACHEFDNALSDSRVKAKINSKYQLQKIDVDRNRQTALKYAKNGEVVLPTVIIADANGNIITKQEGYMTPDQILGIL